MMTARHVTAFISAGSLLAVSSLAYGQSPTPTQADFDRCNQLAKAAVVANPSASPGSSTSATPGTSNPAPAPSSVGPSTSGGDMPSGSAGRGASPSSDPLLRGMATAGAPDPAYQAAYRDCMRSK